MKELKRFIQDKDTCFDCKFKTTRTYDTGTGIETEYRCMLQNNKLIYTAIRVNPDKNDVPNCPIGMFEME